MNRHPVSSSDIASIGYDSTSSQLEIEFRKGGVYMYMNVQEAVYSQLMNSASKGSFFHQFIKEKYSYHKIS
jgi:hypothetical protein